MNRVWVALDRAKNIKLMIEEDGTVGFYLIVYPFDSDVSIKDFLCDDLDGAMLEAFECYGIQKEQWKLEKELKG